MEVLNSLPAFFSPKAQNEPLSKHRPILHIRHSLTFWLFQLNKTIILSYDNPCQYNIIFLKRGTEQHYIVRVAIIIASCAVRWCSGLPWSRKGHEVCVWKLNTFLSCFRRQRGRRCRQQWRNCGQQHGEDADRERWGQFQQACLIRPPWWC